MDDPVFASRAEQKIKIYTGTGDRGRTSLFSGERVSKSYQRVEAYGDVDELNSVLAGLVAVLPQEQSELITEVQRIQSDLLHVGAWLATTPGSPSRALLEKVGDAHIRTLEGAIDRMEDKLPELKGFILPGGHISAAWAHVARTVCRRAERKVVQLFDEPIEDVVSSPLRGVLVYLNRLSDYFFVLARHCNQVLGIQDIPWKK
jgi:cob(I)alamin adenosyltransferase